MLMMYFSFIDLIFDNYLIGSPGEGVGVANMIVFSTLWFIYGLVFYLVSHISAHFWQIDIIGMELANCPT